ncbi:MAG: AAA family ATPase [Thermoanaerobaculia bacterium]|nr:AAA family ATPase [Thermoanaerobaculia bacterium]
MSRKTSVHDLERLILSFHSLIAVETAEEERVRSILIEVAAELRMPLYEWSVTTGLMRRAGITIEGTRDALSALDRIGEVHDGDAIYLMKDLAPHLNQSATARTLRELTSRLASTRSAIVLTGDPVELPHDLEFAAVRLELHLPDPEEVRQTIREVVDSISARKHVQLDLSRDEAQQLVRALSGLTISQVRRVIALAILADDRLSVNDIDRVIRWKGEIIERGGLLEFYPVDGNQFELGGFDRLKRWLEQTKVGFSSEARALNLHPPKGVLFVGVQGCGKSLAAKYVARQWRLPLLKLDAGRLYDKYIGESEKNFRKATELAEAMAPAVLWIDEIEKAFAPGGDNDGGTSQRLFGAFLTWLQEKKKEVFVVGAANDLNRLPPELLRKGRFDEIFFVDLPDESERASIFAVHLRLRKQDPARFDLAKLAAESQGFSGAEIEQGVVSALYRSLHAKSPLTSDGIVEALHATTPLSVTRAEDIEAIRANAAGRFTPVK